MSNWKNEVRVASNATRADVGTTETLISAVPCVLVGLIPNAANTGAVLLRDAAATAGASDPVINASLGDGTTAGANTVTGIAARFENGITIEGADALCDVTVLWEPL